MTAIERYRQAAYEAARPDPDLTVSEWADQYRYLSLRSSSEPGPWRTSRVPYLKAIMDDLSPSSPVERVVFQKSAQTGGPLALDTPIPTTEGWTTMGEITVSDQVFDENGHPCWVMSVSPVFDSRDCYRVSFSDGSSLIADGAHRWRVWRKLGAMREELCIRRTEEMLLDYCYQKNNGNEHRYSIDLIGPLVLPKTDLPIDPYVLGYWLGNGAARQNSASAHTDDADEIAWHLASSGLIRVDIQPPRRPAQGKTATLLLDGGHPLEHGTDGRFTVAVADEEPYFPRAVRALGLINNKHIPLIYQRAAIADRLALLQGLMDSDGSIDKQTGQCVFSTSNPVLRDAVFELIAGLGLKAGIGRTPPKINPAIHHGPIHSKENWRIRFTAYSDIPVFRLRRKLIWQKDRSSGQPTETGRRRITRIESTQSVPVRCIGVSSESHLFAAGKSLIVSHNTELGNNWIGYVMHLARGPMMAVQPSIEMAKRNSKQRITPLIEDSPVLRARVREEMKGPKSSTLMAKEFPGGLLVMTGANSGKGLRSMSARYLFLDEVDGYPGDVDKEGDPCELAIARTATYGLRAKIYIVSTPTISGISRIEKYYDQSDQRHFWIPCPHCGEYMTLDLAGLRWPPGRPEEAVYICEACEKPIRNESKTEMLAAGEWRCDKPPSDKVHGYHINSLYSPVGWLTWAAIAAKREAAGKIIEKLQVFVNTVLGLPYAETGEVPDSDRLYERREDYAIGTVPAGGLLLTCGVDVQVNRIEAEIVAWGRDKQSWSVDYRVFEGPTNQPAVWAQLSELLSQEYPCESGARMRIRRMAVDSGFNTMSVYDWVRRAPLQVIAVKGASHVSSLIGRPTAIEVGPQGRTVKYGIRLWPVNTTIAKEELYRWLRGSMPDLSRGEPWPQGYCHFPMYSKEFFEELTAEHLVTRTISGRRVTRWEQIRERNEALDCFDAETEVLTDNGWKSFVEVESERLATVCLESDEIEFQKPLELISRQHSGEMVHLHSRRLDVLVTPNHRMVTYLPNRNPEIAKQPLITLAKDLTQRHQIKLTGEWRQKGPCCIMIPPSTKNDSGSEIEPMRNVKAEDLAAFYGWWITDGSARQVPDTCMRRVTIHQTKVENIEAIAALLDRLPWSFHWATSNDRFECTSKQLYEEVIQCGQLQIDRRVPFWIKQGSREVIESFIQAATLGDGWVQKDGARIIATVCKELADDYQELFIKLGNAPRIHRYKAQPYTIRDRSGTETRDQYHVHENARIKKASLDGGGEGRREYLGRTIPYDGRVYCAAVPNGTLICRRDGQVFVAGNCRVYARAAALSMRVDSWSKSKWDDLEDQVSNPDNPASADSARISTHSATPVPEFRPIRQREDWLE